MEKPIPYSFVKLLDEGKAGLYLLKHGETYTVEYPKLLELQT